MQINYVDSNGREVTIAGLFGLNPKDMEGRLAVYHSRIVPVNNSGRCKPLEAKKKAIFLVLLGSEVKVGSLGNEFLLGVRIDDPSEPLKTCLVCKCGLREFERHFFNFHKVKKFVKKIRMGHIPLHHEVPGVLLSNCG
jgi:hypothetical protein